MYTGRLLLFGRPSDPACVDLYRLLDEEAEEIADRTARRAPAPAELRWEFELAAFDADQPEVQTLAAELRLDLGKERSPLLAVLGADGSLTARYPLKLEREQQLDSRALADFLKRHKPATRDAERMLAEALRRAKDEDKRVFFIASASWCGPCRRLARFLEAQQAELERHYVFVKLDVSRDERGEAVRARYQGKQDDGVPWYALVDADGTVLITSNAAESKSGRRASNIGFPSSAEGVAHFVQMLRQTAPRLSEDRLAELRQALTKSQ
jgi:thiol-disulfide isomerase/thioredoxin